MTSVDLIKIIARLARVVADEADVMASECQTAPRSRGEIKIPEHQQNELAEAQARRYLRNAGILPKT